MQSVAVAVVALVLAVGALAVGIVALAGGDGNGDGDGPRAMTLNLIEERENERPLRVGREPALTYGSPISGDEQGELAGVCLPVGRDGIGCESTFFLPGGTITTQNARMLDDPQINSPIVGGTGVYGGAGGTHTIPNPNSGQHTLHLLLPE